MDDLVQFLAPIWVTALTVYGIACGVVGGEPGAPLWLRWPLPVWNRVAYGWRTPAPAVRRPDYLRIALLEHELFGIEPEPGTAAAAVINLRRATSHLRELD